MFSYMGSKWRLAKKYGKPEYDLVIEPFAGGACYSLYWEVPKALLFDLNPAVAGIWKYLISAKESEIRALPVDFETTENLKIPQEAKWLIGFWIGKGRTSPAKMRSAWGRQYRSSTNCRVWGEPLRERIAKQISKIRQWQIRCESYENAPHIKADWFIDPPYEVQGKNYPCSYVNYEELAIFSRSRNGRVIVCENEGATWLPFIPFAEIRGCKGTGRSGVSREVVYQYAR